MTLGICTVERADTKSGLISTSVEGSKGAIVSWDPNNYLSPTLSASASCLNTHEVDTARMAPKVAVTDQVLQANLNQFLPHQPGVSASIDIA